MKRNILRSGVIIACMLITAFVLQKVWRARTSPLAQHAATQTAPHADPSTVAASGSVHAASAEEISAKLITPAKPTNGNWTLWAPPTQVGGDKLIPGSTDAVEARLQGHAAKGRTGVIATDSIASIENLHEGQAIDLPVFDGQSIQARVQLVQADQGWIRTGGPLEGDRKGTFSLATDGTKVSATILLPDEKLAYQIEYQGDGQTVMTEKLLSDVVCSPIPLDPTPMAAAAVTTGSVAAIPVLSSRPSAVAVLYLDFDGETVTDPAWNKGVTINALAYNLTAAQITDIWNRVKEDYIVFNIDVTTDVTRYNNAPVGKRMRCIITPTNTAAPGSGGVAYLRSFAQAGTTFSSTIPCWVFNGGVDGIAEAVSHELGHTFGLAHDGLTSPATEYYTGQGTGVTRWGPIMGASYGAGITQWSKGEYANANNHEDDVAIIGNTTNGFGFIADEAGNTQAAATTLTAPGGTINQSGLITQQSDADCYSFTTSGGSVTVNADPAAVRPNFDILLRLLSSSGAIMAESNPDLAFNATLTTTVAAGTYTIRIVGTGRADPLVDGYTSYGSLGDYTLTGMIPVNAIPAPVVTSATTLAVAVGSNLSYQITATNSPSSYSVVGTLPAGASLNTTTGLISGTPTAAGTYNVTIGATNSTGTGIRSLAITVNAVVSLPVITSATTLTVSVSSPLSYQVIATNSPTSYSVTGTLPAGVSLNTTTGLISGTPTAAGTFSVTIGATNSGGTGSATLTIKTVAAGMTLETALDASVLIWTTGGDAPWAPETTTTADGIDAAQAGKISANQTSWIETTVTGPVTLSFKWKVSSEKSYDFLRFIANGNVITSTSGSSGWVTRTYNLSSAATYTLRWSYTKDESVDSGSDTAWLDQVTITPR